MATRRRKSARAAGDIVVTMNSKGKIKHVRYGRKLVTRPGMNLRRMRYRAGTLGEIVNFHLLSFQDVRTGATLRCIHAPNCWLYCH